MSMRTKNLIFGLAAVLVALGVVSVVILLYSSPSQTVYAGSGIDGNGEPFGFDVAEGDTVEIDGESYVMGEDGWAYREDGEVRCASVLSGPLNEPDELSEQRQQREEEELPDDVRVENDLQGGDVSQDAWVVADCDRLRQQRLGWAVLVGIPTLMLFTLAVYGRPRRATSA
jgi:hypothetical protein